MNSSTDWWRPPRPEVRLAEAEVINTRGSALCFWALVGFTVILLLAPQQQFPVLAPFRIALLSAAAALLACSYYRLSRQMPLIVLSPDVILMLMLTAWAVVTIPFSIWPGGSVSFFTGYFIKAVIFFLIVSHAIFDVRQLRGICWTLVLCTIPLTLITLANYLAGRHMEGGGERVAGYSSGLAGNPNDMALMLNLILPVCIALFLGTRSSIKKLVLAGIAGMIVIAVIATFSRAGFLTLVFIGICYAWLLRNRPQRVLIPIALAVGLMALPFVPAQYYDRLDTIINVEQDETGSGQARLADMQVATAVALSSPVLGAGLGNSVLAMNDARGDHWVDVHNVYLQLAIDLGVIGLVLFVLILLRCLRVLRDVVDRRTELGLPDSMVFIAEALRVSLLAFALSAMFYPVSYNFYFYFFAGLAIATGRIARGETRGAAS